MGCITHCAEVVWHRALLNVRLGSQWLTGKPERQAEHKIWAGDRIRAGPLTDRLPVTQAGALLSLSSGAGAPHLSDILEIISGCSLQWRTWTCFTLGLMPVKSSLVSGVIYFGYRSPWNWAFWSALPVPGDIWLKWVGVRLHPPVIQGHRCFGVMPFPWILKRCGCFLKWSCIQLLAHLGNSEELDVF